MGKRSSLLARLGIVLSASITGLILGPRVPVYHGGCSTCKMWVLKVARSTIICIDPIGDIVYRKGGIV